MWTGFLLASSGAAARLSQVPAAAASAPEVSIAIPACRCSVLYQGKNDRQKGTDSRCPLLLNLLSGRPPRPRGGSRSTDSPRVVARTSGPAPAPVGRHSQPRPAVNCPACGQVALEFIAVTATRWEKGAAPGGRGSTSTRVSGRFRGADEVGSPASGSVFRPGGRDSQSGSVALRPHCACVSWSPGRRCAFEHSLGVGTRAWNQRHHGLRSTFRDWDAETGMPCDIAEAVRAHRVENSTEAACAGTD